MAYIKGSRYGGQNGRQMNAFNVSEARAAEKRLRSKKKTIFD